MKVTPIGKQDIVSVSGKYLVKEDGSRFLMKGIGFPISVLEGYNATAWIGILHQLKSLDLEYNTVRIYDMDPIIDYSEFMKEAANLGVYVIVPLTAIKGDGVLARDKAAPTCYPRKLFSYGVASLENYLQYPNVVAGLLANEVVDTLETWEAAPCVKAYGRDLKLYMGKMDRSLPLIYAAQHSGIGAAFSSDDAMKVTMQYLTCDESAIDVFGINIESWCSSLESFGHTEDGELGSYYSLWQSMRTTTIPIIFTEMGCSHDYFDKDNGLHDSYGTRDWKQVSVVLHQMVDTWSGFCAYVYSGNPMFDMFNGGPWRNDPLNPTLDFFNFRDELHKVAHLNATQPMLTNAFDSTTKMCTNVEQALASCCDIHLQSFSKIAPYYYTTSTQVVTQHSHITLVFAGVVGFFLARKFWRNKKDGYESIEMNV